MGANVSAAKACLSNTYLAIFAVSIVNMEAAVVGVRLVAHIYFSYFAYKNYNVRGAVLAT